MRISDLYRQPSWLRGPQFGCSIDDPAAGDPPGGGAPAPAPTPGAPPPANDADAAKLAEIQKQNEALAKKAKALEDADARRKKEADDAKKAKDLEDGKARDLLTAAEKQLEEEKARGAKLLASITARTDAQLGSLPEDAQTRLAGYKDKVSADVWALMVDDAVAAAIAPGGGVHPAPRPPGRGAEPNDDKKIIGAEAQEYLDAHTYSDRDVSIAELANEYVERHEVPAAEGGSVGHKFVFPIRKQLEMRGATRRPLRFIEKKD